jgi:hypothetical protein
MTKTASSAATPAKISAVLVALSRRALGIVAESCPGLLAASVATKDGRIVAQTGAAEAASKIPVMGGTMHALGDALVEEATLGRCLNVIVEADEGKVVMLSVPDSRSGLVVIGIAGAEANLGLLLRACRSCAEDIGARLKGPG